MRLGDHAHRELHRRFYVITATCQAFSKYLTRFIVLHVTLSTIPGVFTEEETEA